MKLGDKAVVAELSEIYLYERRRASELGKILAEEFGRITPGAPPSISTEIRQDALVSAIISVLRPRAARGR